MKSHAAPSCIGPAPAIAVLSCRAAFAQGPRTEAPGVGVPIATEWSLDASDQTERSAIKSVYPPYAERLTKRARLFL